MHTEFEQEDGGAKSRAVEPSEEDQKPDDGCEDFPNRDMRRCADLQKISTLLLHRDARLTMLITRQNIDIAESSRSTAQATRLDSQSMKTIAILTMVFLPGTFVAVSHHLCFIAISPGLTMLAITVFIQQYTFQLVCQSRRRDRQRLCVGLFCHHHPDDGHRAYCMVALDSSAKEASVRRLHFKMGKRAAPKLNESMAQIESVF